jgi:hypothetical protein
MTLLEYYENGIIKDLYKKGMISLNLVTYYRYYLVYQAYKAKGLSNNKSYTYASDECGTCETTIRKAVKIITT